MWGIHLFIVFNLVVMGITPTYVGNTTTDYLLGHEERDHPHVCGEYKTGRPRPDQIKGSPPRMWGIRVVVYLYKTYFGITPTYVGNTRSPVCRFCPSGDHPHVCGEYYRISGTILKVLGSPPRMWGIRKAGHFNDLCTGITPTYVGNTYTNWRKFAWI